MNSVTQRIYEFNQGLAEDIVHMKYNFMRENPFRFFRGTCHLFFEDWSQADAAQSISAPLSWITGDLHLENFGSYKAANRLVYFDLNDFDEAILAPVTWEIARTVASIFVAFGALNIEEKKALRMAQQFLKKLFLHAPGWKSKIYRTKDGKRHR